MSLTIEDGGLASQPPSDSRVYTFDYDDNLAPGVQIATSSFAIVAVRPSSATLPTKDNESRLSGNRQTQLRLLNGTLGARYKITNTAVTDETPAQTKHKHFYLLIE